MKHFAKSMMLLFALSTINLFWFQPIHASNGILEKEAQQALKDVVNDIKLKVQSYWSAGDAYPGYVVTINIVVGPRGDVISANVVDGSGDSSFDKLAIKTLFDSSPLPFPQNPKYYNYINSFNFVFRGSTISGSSKPIGERATEDSQTKQPVTNNRPTVAKSHSNDLINRVGVGAAITYIFTALIVLYVFFYSYKKIIRSI